MTMRRHVAALLLFITGLLVLQPAAACTGGGCVSAGPRLASISSSQGPLLNALLNTLGGGNVNLTVADWNTVAAGDVSLAKTLNALQATLNVSTPQQSLTANATVAQIISAMATAAQLEGGSALKTSLNTLAAQITLPGTIRLGDLLQSDGIYGNTRLNALSLVTGVVQLYNTKNVVSTATPISITGLQLGLVNIINSIQLRAQVIEPPVYVCGPQGSTFHTASIRVMLHLDLVSIALNLGILNVSANVGQLDLYIEVGRADGVLGAIDAITNALTVQVTPGVASLYLGTIDDSLFFNRNRPITAADVTPGNIGSLSLLGTTVAIRARAIAIGSSPVGSQLQFSGAGLQTRTAYTSANFAGNLITSLIANLQLSLTPTGLLDYLLSALSPVLAGVLSPVLSPVLTGIVDPLLSLLGIRLGEVDVTSGGTVLSCIVSGCVYADANHSSKQDSGETGTGATLYAKLVATATPTVADAVATVDPVTGNYAFSGVLPASYLVVVNGDSTKAVVAPAAPASWVGTETPTLSKAVTVATSDLQQQRFGLFRGSKLSGTVFKDDGTGTGGIANNGLKDGLETAIGATALRLTDSTGTLVVDSTSTDAAGAYTLWIPHAQQGVALKLLQPADATAWVSVSGRAGTTGGSYALATDTLSFTPTSGNSYTGADFGDVPVNRWDTDGLRVAAPGTTVLFPHRFQAGTAGSVSFTPAAVGSAPTGWSATLFRDTACDGNLDAGDTALTTPTALAAGQAVCVIVKVFIPAETPLGQHLAVSVTASFAYANNGLNGALKRQDLTEVGGGALQLVKSVDRTDAASGQVVVYTITFVNAGASPLTGLKISDATPAYTVAAGATCGSVPAGMGCSVSLAPAVGSAGPVAWLLSGALPPGGSGQVQFSVKVN